MAQRVDANKTGGFESALRKELSNGELVLAVWAIILHRQKEDLRGAYLLVDEPENHLHPDVCIRALSALQEQILGPDGQIWLATHSVPIIAHAGIESVHFVNNGAMEYAGNKIEKVLDQLLGGHEGRSKLRSLLADADELAFDSFAAQCLLRPGVASAQEGDPQQIQMVKATKDLGANKENVRILDFAAGKGRLAAALRGAGLTANRRSSTSEASGNLANRRPISSTRLRGLQSLMRSAWISW